MLVALRRRDVDAVLLQHFPHEVETFVWGNPRDASAANTYAPPSAPKPFQKCVHCTSPPNNAER
jgi:hypothetical protein